MVRSAFDFFRVFRVIRGKNAIVFLTPDYTDQSLRPNNNCSLLERIDVFAFSQHAGRTN